MAEQAIPNEILDLVLRVARQAVREMFKDQDVFEDAFYGSEFAQFSDQEWRDVIYELWSPELADEGGLTERAKDRERHIIQAAKQIYEAKRREIKARVSELKKETKKEIENKLEVTI